MPRALLVRHGRTTANASGVLAGRTEVALDEVGEADARALGERLAAVPLARIITSPMLRTRQTAELLAGGRPIDIIVDEALAEVEYGEWTGARLADLAKDPLWRVVQTHPSAVTFPQGESMASMSARAVACVRRWIAAAAPSEAVVFVSHGDVIKAVVADALGVHLDSFQRIVVAPASLSAVSFHQGRPFVERVNDVGGSVADLVPPPPAEATPGGATGADGGAAGAATAADTAQGDARGAEAEAAAVGADAGEQG
jgi:probable phosphomutase (TIGR03848 family)